MARVQYVGTSNFREITNADWKSIGVEDQGKVVWDRDKKEVHEISDAAWAWLNENEKGDYKLVTEPVVASVEPIAEPTPEEV